MDARLIDGFRCIVGDAGLVTEAEQLRTYECDGLTLLRVVPDLVLLPSSTQQTANNHEYATGSGFRSWRAAPARGLAAERCP